MQKQKGFTLLELMLTITLVGILSTIAAPSFKRWQRDQAFTSDTETFFDTLADARASAVSEKQCEGLPAVAWVLEVNDVDVTLSCTQEEDENTLNEIRRRKWESPAVITLGYTAENPVADTEWASVPGTLKLTIFAGGTQSIIGDIYGPKWAKVNILFEDLGKEKTVCYSRIANYPYYSKEGTCEE